MMILNFLSIIFCRLTRFVMRRLGSGGTDFPGKVALKVSPNILKEMSRGVKVIIVTGTNGKTTTSRMIEQCLKNAGKTYVANRSGANLLQGITAEFADNCSLTGKCRREYAVVECDEAAFKVVSRHVDPALVVVTNVFRDQLDRYGEVTATLENIKIGCRNSKNAVLCLNADCSLTSSIAAELNNRCVFFGVNCEVYQSRIDEVSDAPYCIRCKSEYAYDYVTFGHLGGWSCPVCGYRRPDPDVAVTGVVETNDCRSVVDMDIFYDSYRVDIGLPGAYNIYNAAATAAAMHTIGIPDETVIGALADFACGFGRMEKLAIEGSDIRMILIKNPAGCNQVLNFLTGLTTPSLFVVCLNDNAQDGRDVSWIWDVDFERLADMSETITGLYVAGIRADDMALRLKYAGVPEEKMKLFYSFDELINAMLKADRPVYIMPNYTAMMDLRDKLAKRFGLKDFWE